MQPIYLDYNATSPLDPAVIDAVTPYLQTHFGNPSIANDTFVISWPFFGRKRLQRSRAMSGTKRVLLDGNNSMA
jgi:cysteine desulfurase